MSIQAMPIPEPIVVALSLTMLDEIAPPMPLEQGKVMEKKKRKDKNAITKRVRRNVGRSSSESSG